MKASCLNRIIIHSNRIFCKVYGICLANLCISIHIIDAIISTDIFILYFLGKGLEI